MNNTNLVEQVNDFMKSNTKPDGNPITQSDMSRSIGVSTSTFNQWINNKYPGDSTAIDDAVTDFLKREAEKRIKPKLQFKFAKTTTARHVHEVCRLAHIDSDIGVVCGDAGLGKTEAVRNYAKRQHSVILIEAHLGYTARNLFQELHKRVGYDGIPGNINKLFNDIVEKLTDSGWLIIIDEAEHLPYKALELLRRVHDKAGIGVVLCGMPRLVSNLRGKKGEYAQLYSRIGSYRALGNLDVKDVELLIAQAVTNTEALAPVFLSECGGNARILTKLLNRTIRLQSINNKRIITADLIRQAKLTLLV